MLCKASNRPKRITSLTVSKTKVCFGTKARRRIKAPKKQCAYLDETQGGTILSKLVNEIEYQYDSRDRLREVKAGQMALGLNPLMHYNLFYDSETPFYMEGLTMETVDHDNNYNGNINGTLMRYDFSGQDVANSISTFAKPTLYGYTYDDINRMIKADATIGDFVLQVGSQSEIDNSYSIGDESVSYDKIGNIRTLLRILKSGIGAPTYTEFEHYNYVYETGKNRLTAANGLFGTASRAYTYDANGNVLTDAFRTITNTEYGRLAYAFHLDKGSDAIDYLYSVDDQRIYKKATEVSGSVQNYYLIDAMGKTLAIRTFDEVTSPKWEYYISGAERECRLVPKATQVPGVNTGNTLPADMVFEKLQATYFLYDHLGNTRVTYTPEGYFNPYDIIDQFSSSTDGWQGNNATVASINNELEVTTLANTSDPLAFKILAMPFVVGQAYTISLDVDMGSVPQGLSLIIQGSQNGPYPLVAGTNTFTFDAWFAAAGLNSMLVVRADGAPFPVDYKFSFDNVTISQVNTITVNEINHVADYFPYGKIVRKFVEGDEERYLTTQHERDEETGLDYRGARYYDSDIGRFLSLDPLASKYPDWSSYSYSFCSPVVFIDDDGKEPTPAALKRAAKALGVPVASIRAVYHVETQGNAFRSNGDPKILFERHYFHRLTDGKFDNSNPDISSASRGGYGSYSEQIGKLKRAIMLDEKAAYESASYGGFQIMGANYKAAGYNSAKEFATAMMSKNEDVHLEAFVNYIINTSGLKEKLQEQDWAGFAKQYNGPKYKENNYDTKMKDAFDKFSDDPERANVSPDNRGLTFLNSAIWLTKFYSND